VVLLKKENLALSSVGDGVLPKISSCRLLEIVRGADHED